MSSLDIVPVKTRSARKAFVQLPWDLYRGDPNWIAPLRQDLRERVGYLSHPFYDDAEIQTFLAMRDKKPCGRIAAIVNHGHNRRFKEQRGFFGFFESIDDQAVANGLFDAARSWFAERDITMMRGPTNPSLNYEIGTLVDGFDSPPTFMMTYNPPYHGRLIEEYGFRKTQDLYEFWGHLDMLKTLDKKLAFVAEESAKRFNVTLRRIDTSRYMEDVRMFLRIYNESLGGTWGYVPLSEGEVNHMAAGMRRLLVPEMTTVAEIDGKPIGVALALLDYNPRIHQIDGRLYPFGFLTLLRNKRAIKKIRSVSTNVVPEYQKWGLGLALLDRLVPDLLEWGIEEVEFSWALESNHLSRKTLERGGAITKKTYRLYDWSEEESDI